MKLQRSASWIITAAIVCLSCTDARAQSFAYERIALEGDAAGHGRTFASFREVAIDGENVVFRARTTGGEGIFLATDQTISALADDFTAVPDGTGEFTFFGWTRIAGNFIAFVARGDNEQHGVYRINLVDRQIVRVADLSSTIPAGLGQFEGFGSVSVDEAGTVVFDAYGPNDANGRRQGGVYGWQPQSGLFLVFNRSQTVPALEGPFSNVNFPAVDSSLVCFRGDADAFAPVPIGIYLMGNASPLLLVGRDQPVPELPGFLFANFGNELDVRDFEVVFYATGYRTDDPNARATGYYLAANGGITPVVAPGAVDPCNGFGLNMVGLPADYEGGAIVFSASTNGFTNAVYTTLGTAGELRRVIAPGARLDNRTVLSASSFAEALSDSRIAFWANTQGSSSAGEGIWVASFVPGPILGDIDLDGDVDLTDLATLLANFGVAAGATLQQGDIDGDQAVGLSDLAILLANFGQPC